MANDISAGELRMDTTSLYREEVITDRRIGSIRVLTPLKPDGSTDTCRWMTLDEAAAVRLGELARHAVERARTTVDVGA